MMEKFLALLLTGLAGAGLALVNLAALAAANPGQPARAAMPPADEPVYLPVVLSASRPYYVAPSGSDGNPGTIDRPWRTIQKAANTLRPGETVYVRGGVYREAVVVNVSGSAIGGYITFRSYPGETAVLDGTGLTVPAGLAGMILIIDQSYLVIQGFEIRNYKTVTPGRVPVGIHIRGAAHHLRLIENRVHHIETNAPVDADLLGADAHGIAVYGTSPLTPSHEILIEGNELHNLKLGSSEALVLNGNVAGFTVTRNLVHDCDNIGLDFIGFEENCPDPACDQARAGLVSENTVYNIDTLNNPAYGGERSAGGIYVDGGADIVIERNRVFSANIGIEIASEHQGRATSGIVVRSNWLAYNHMAGIAMGGYDTERGRTEHCSVLNNTLYHNDTDGNGTGELMIQFDTRNNIIKNNIIVATDQGLFISNPYTENRDNLVDYNLYYFSGGDNAAGTWEWQAATYEGLAAYQAGTGNDSHARFADPLLVNPAALDFHRQAGSPAGNAGQNLAVMGAADIDGEARLQVGVVDLGADERP